MEDDPSLSSYIKVSKQKQKQKYIQKQRSSKTKPNIITPINNIFTSKIDKKKSPFINYHHHQHQQQEYHQINYQQNIQKNLYNNLEIDSQPNQMQKQVIQKQSNIRYKDSYNNNNKYKNKSNYYQQPSSLLSYNNTAQKLKKQNQNQNQYQNLHLRTQSRQILQQQIKKYKLMQKQWYIEKQSLLKNNQYLQSQIQQLKNINSNLMKKAKHKRTSSQQHTFIFNQTNISSIYPMVMLQSSNWSCKTHIRSHLDSVRALYWYGDFLISGSDDGLVKIWQKDQVKTILRQHLGPIYSICGNFHMFSNTNQKFNFTQNLHHNYNQNQYFFTAGAQGLIRMWKINYLLQEKTLNTVLVDQGQFNSDCIWQLSYNPSKNILLTSSADGTCRLIHINTQNDQSQIENQIQMQKQMLRDYQQDQNFKKQQEQFSIKSLKQKTGGINIQSHRFLQKKQSLNLEFQDQQETYKKYQFQSKKQTNLPRKSKNKSSKNISVSYNYQNNNRMKQGKSFSIKNTIPTSVDWLNSNKFICGYTNNYKLASYDIQIGSQLRQYIFTAKQQDSQTNKVIFAQRHKIIISGHQDRCLRFFDPNSGKLMKVITGHSDGITSILTKPDSYEVISCSHDGCLRIWDLRKYRCVHDIPLHMKKYDEGALCMAQRRQQFMISVGGADGHIKLLSPQH